MVSEAGSVHGGGDLSLAEKLDRIRAPKLQNQRETGVVLSAIEETLKDQSLGTTPTGYFAALLALLSQSTSTSNGIVNKELATSVAYLLDLVAAYVPPQLLRSKFSQILTSLAPVLSQSDVEAPLIRSSIGCLESLLIAQDGTAWALPQSQVGPRKAVAGLLVLASDHRPKVRKRAQEALAHVLQNPPPSPSLDHPAIDMCAETALHNVRDVAEINGKAKRKGKDQKNNLEHQPATIHALQLTKTIASASGGWPSKKIEPLCEILMQISKSQNEFLTMMAFEIFEVVFAGMADEVSSVKLPRLLEALTELRPNQNDSQLLPPWIAVISRGYDISAQVSPEETFQKLPGVFELLSGFLTSSSHNIRISASECLISFLVNCIPTTVILEPSVYDEKTLEKLGRHAYSLLSVKFQTAWMEVFTILSAMFSAFKWRSAGLLDEIVKTVGELRANEAFTGKKEADALLGEAVAAMGPEAVLKILPLNLSKPARGQPGRAWLLPILRDHVQSTNLMHFRTELVPLSEAMFQRVLDHGSADKTMEIKIFETLVHQIWATLPGYCAAPLDLSIAFDKSFGEMLGNLLYSQTELRADICKALQTLVESNQAIVSSEAPEQDLLLHQRMTKGDAQKNLDHLAGFAGSLLAVLFNVYSETLPQNRGYILQCINSYLSITLEKELSDTFSNVTTMLESALKEPLPTKGSSTKGHQTMPPKTHTLTDLLITLSPHLPTSTHSTLFTLTSSLIPMQSDPPLQKKAYKLLPRLSTTPHGAAALRSHTARLQALLLSSASSVSPPARRDRLAAIATLIPHLPNTNLAFIPSILSEVVLAAKEVNEKARAQAFDLLVLMGKRMSEPNGVVVQSQIPAMGSEAPDVPATLEEFFTMVSAGLVGSTPHVISASITALSRLLYEFSAQLESAVIEDLVQTMELFLSSPSREIVRSVLGFVKVVVVSLPVDVVKPRLEKLVPALLGWSREHKARVRVRVKHILERMIRRFGGPAVEGAVGDAGEDGRKFVHNIVKTRERAKRQKAGKKAEDADNADGDRQVRRGGVESGYDDAIASDTDSDDGSGDSDDMDEDTHEKARRGPKRKDGDERGVYITEDNDEPLDLLSRSSLAHISSRKPAAGKTMPATAAGTKRKHKTNQDGKLIFGTDDDNDDADMAGEADDAMMLDAGDEDMTLEDGVNAYVDAIRGKDAAVRGRGGRLKFSNKKEKGKDGGEVGADKKSGADGVGGKKVRFAGAGDDGGGAERGGGRSVGRGRGARGRVQGYGPRGGRGGIAKRVQRKGLGGRMIGGAGVGNGVGRR